MGLIIRPPRFRKDTTKEQGLCVSAKVTPAIHRLSHADVKRLCYPKRMCVHVKHTSACVSVQKQTYMNDSSQSDVTNTRHKGVDPSPKSHMPKSNPLHHLHPDPAIWSSHP